jgi:hypothetical protein
MRPRQALVLLVAIASTLVAAPAAGAADPPPPLPRFFAANGVWNQQLATNARLASNSSRLVAGVRNAVQTYGTWINTTSYSTPVYTVPVDQPTVRVTVTTAPTWDVSKTLQSQFDAVPLPPDARPASGTDACLVVWQPSTDTMWEFWQLQSTPDGWTASWGGKMTSVSTDTGIFPAPYGATATSLPLVGGLMTINELQAGHIDHALAFAMPHPAAGTFVYPAQRTDGDGPSSGVPEGTRFRLPASLNIDALNLPPMTAMIAKAVQRYGMVLNNMGSVVAFYGEDPAQIVMAGGYNPYPLLDSFFYPNQLLSVFPWDKLQAVAP